MSGIVYKQFRAETKLDADGIITATLSTEAEDRDGDVIRADGWDLSHFNKHPVLICDHNYAIRSVVGEWKNVRVERGALVGEPHFFHGKGNPDADWGWELAKMGKAAFSVGFAPLEDAPRKGAGGREYKRQELLECSIVAIPSNPEALQRFAKSLQGGVVKDIANELISEGAVTTKDGPVQCCVSGCDDMSSAHVGVCADHLRALCALPPNPPSGVYGRALDELLDASIREMFVLGRDLRRHAKAGRQISGGNMDKVHAILQAAHGLHDANCSSENCPYNMDDDSDDDGDKHAHRHEDKAMGESSGSAGGVAVASDGSHAPFDGTHSHPHPAFGSQGDDASHAHDHSHDGDASHDHSHADKALKAPMSVADQNDLPDSAFAVILPGGTKDAEGKTVPRSNRLLPHHKADGSLDLPHLKFYAGDKNALARVSQIDAPADVKAAAEKHLEAHAKEAKIGDYADGEKTLDMGALIEAAIEKASRQLEVN